MKNLLKQFYKNKNGAVSIEFIFMIILLLFIFAFLADLAILRSTQGRLDNASYSMVNILRERTYLYNSRAEFKDKDLEEFRELAKEIMFGDKKSPKHLDVTLEYWWGSAPPDKVEPKEYQSTSNSCIPYRKLRELDYLSPRSESVNDTATGQLRKIPMYQVTLCMETNSFFKALTVSKEKQSGNSLRSSSFSISR